MTIKCVSSQMMTKLLEWRNPHGSEENWPTNPLINNRFKHYTKVVTTELALAGLMTLATVETIGYSLLTVAALFLYPVTSKPCKFSVKLLESSTFTGFIWITKDFKYNLSNGDLATQESFSRHSLRYCCHLFYRREDREYLANWAHLRDANHPNPEVAAIIAEGLLERSPIAQGAKFIRENVLVDASSETKELFKDMDDSIFMFIVTKAIFIYTAGSRRYEEIPHFFKETTRNSIIELREAFDNRLLNTLSEIMKDPDRFEKEIKDFEVLQVFNSVKAIGYGELQDSDFITKCWTKAANEI